MKLVRFVRIAALASFSALGGCQGAAVPKTSPQAQPSAMPPRAALAETPHPSPETPAKPANSPVVVDPAPPPAPAEPAEPAPQGLAALPPPPASQLVVDLASSDPMVRYTAAYWGTRLTPEQASPELRAALIKLLQDQQEPAGTLAWVERAVARVVPQAITLFEALESRGKPVSADAWIEAGPRALAHFRRVAPREDFADWVAVSVIVRAAPDDPESIKTIPLLLSGMEAAEQWKALAIRALEPMGTKLSARLAVELRNQQPSVRRQAALALGLMGCDAASARPELERAAQADKDASVRGAATQTVEALRSNCASSR